MGGFDRTARQIIPFPRKARAGRSSNVKNTDATQAKPGRATEGDPVSSAFADVSRRIEDLARRLNCLGHFEDENDRPRAA